MHEKWNERIEDEFGHPMGEIDSEIEEFLNLLRKTINPIDQLAVTACLEHFTSGFGYVFIGTPAGLELVKRCQEPQKSLWMWHAVEEIEHKKVAFDTYKAMEGGYLRRAITMLFVTPLFLYRIVELTLRFCKARGLGGVGTFVHLMKWLFWSPGLLTKFIPHWLLWFKPSYHPSEHDARDYPPMYKAMALLEHKKKDGVLVFGPHEHPPLSIEHLDDEDDKTLSVGKSMTQHIENAVVSAKL